MTKAISLFEINNSLNISELSSQFARNGRVQIANFLTDETAAEISKILMHMTPWGIAWQIGDSGPKNANAQELGTWSNAKWQEHSAHMMAAMSSDKYGFQFAQYPMLDAYLGKWDEGGPHDLILEHLNSEPFLECMRTVTGISRLIKADAQATHYSPNHFLSVHNDSHVGEGWRTAYVLNMCPIEWRAEWGGILLFHDENGDIVKGFLPRFNTLNIFKVPQLHSVSMVSPFAPNGRYAITGWLRDR